jgi:hypothetical protein
MRLKKFSLYSVRFYVSRCSSMNNVFHMIVTYCVLLLCCCSAVFAIHVLPFSDFFVTRLLTQNLINNNLLLLRITTPRSHTSVFFLS